MPSANQAAENARIERLVGLAKVWGAAKYFHPFPTCNEDAASQAEHTALFFQAARPDMTFIGTPTTDANDDVTRMVLPGNLSVSFPGHSVRHADGRQSQRIGIQPTVRVAPMIRGMIEGRDEILETAIKFLQPGKTTQ